MDPAIPFYIVFVALPLVILGRSHALAALTPAVIPFLPPPPVPAVIENPPLANATQE